MENKRFKLVIASGKGGVGKSMLASALAMLFAKEKKIVIVDCDVDAPNLAIWLGGVKDWNTTKSVITSAKPVIDLDKCNGCGLCVENCQFEALKIINNKAKLNPFICEGCGVCQIVCPEKAIELEVPVMIHSGWGVEGRVQDIGKLAEDYPDGTFVCCHMKEEYGLNDRFSHIKMAAQNTNVYLESSYIPHPRRSEDLRGSLSPTVSHRNSYHSSWLPMLVLQERYHMHHSPPELWIRWDSSYSKSTLLPC